VSVDVQPVRSGRDRRAFIDLPYRLHATSPQWTPPLRIERRLFLTPRFNAFFKHGEAQLFLARRDGRVVGRISAHIDHAFNAFHDSRWGMWGFFECEDDQEAADALLAAAESWHRTRGRDRMVGPMDFTMNDESGIVIEGGELDAMIRQPWHPPYYRELCERAGLEKAMDLLMWNLEVSDRSRILPVIVELAERCGPDHGIGLRHMTRRTLRRDLDVFGEIYNAAWSRNWGFVPYGEHDLDAYAQELQLVFDPDWFLVAERQATGEAVGIAITVPDVNQVLRRMNGRILPLGWWHFLRKRRIIDRCRVGFLGVRPEEQHTGVAALLYIEHFDMAEVARVKRGEMGWILETNVAMNRGMEAMGGRVVKRYRMYERRLDPAAAPAYPAGARVWEPEREAGSPTS
jgi:hypothetical protein